MPALIANLPVHPLVVHAVVVLVPLAVLTGITVAVWPAVRRRYGWPVVGLAVLATVSIPVATDSGEQLRDRLPDNALIEQHAQLGDQLLAFVAPLALVLLALMLLDHHRARISRVDGPGTTTKPVARWLRPAGVALSVLAIGFGAASAVQVVRIGDSGAHAVWHDTKYVAPTRHGDD